MNYKGYEPPYTPLEMWEKAQKVSRVDVAIDLVKAGDFLLYYYNEAMPDTSYIMIALEEDVHPTKETRMYSLTIMPMVYMIMCDSIDGLLEVFPFDLQSFRMIARDFFDNNVERLRIASLYNNLKKGNSLN